jgi:putative hydrolase of the HAD superfamily
LELATFIMLNYTSRNMKHIGAIGFDWSGVILQYPRGNFNDAAAEFLGVTGEQFRRAYFLHNHMVNKGDGAKGYGEATEMWGAILSELGVIDKLDRFIHFVRNQPEGVVSQEMLSLLEKLRQKGWKLGLFSNHSIEGAQTFRKNSYDTYFDVALFSAEVGCMKPEPEAFKMLASMLDVPVSELIFIDDSERSLSTAHDVGYIPILFTDANTLVDQLGLFGIKL